MSTFLELHWIPHQMAADRTLKSLLQSIHWDHLQIWQRPGGGKRRNRGRSTDVGSPSKGDCAASNAADAGSRGIGSRHGSIQKVTPSGSEGDGRRCTWDLLGHGKRFHDDLIVLFYAQDQLIYAQQESDVWNLSLKGSQNGISRIQVWLHWRMQIWMLVRTALLNIYLAAYWLCLGKYIHKNHSFSWQDRCTEWGQYMVESRYSAAFCVNRSVSAVKQWESHLWCKNCPFKAVKSI